jgi:hypothetical protein
MKEPTAVNRSRYTAEVMTRIKRLGSAPTPAPIAVRLPWVRFAFAAATATSLLFIVTALRQPAPPQLAQDIDELSSELEELDTIMLAESLSSAEEEAWMEQTLQLLEELDEEVPEDSGIGPSDDDDWLEELELFDESELATSS